jgi:hypothetical protein
VSFDNHQFEWVRLSVGILAQANNIDNENPLLFANYKCPVLAVIDRVCVHIHDTKFQLGLVNLIDSFLDFEGRDQIINSHNGVMEALSSYILQPSHQHFSTSRDKFSKFLYVIMLL